MISNKDIYLFVYDATNVESFEFLQQQLQEVMDLTKGQMTGMVVSNKMDLEDVVRIDPKDGYQSAVNFNLDFVQTSAFRTGNPNINNEEILNKISGNIYNAYSQHLEFSDKLFKMK
mmetsp:Transcript_66228/g.56289  ORF Transcript_66228/g.56289 Transcript_66228/m.56289 type:complete len:116 (+) Transcript_66228:248-595(+)